MSALHRPVKACYFTQDMRRAWRVGEYLVLQRTTLHEFH